jgi:hypothetical protein
MASYLFVSLLFHEFYDLLQLIFFLFEKYREKKLGKMGNFISKEGNFRIKKLLY